MWWWQVSLHIEMTRIQEKRGLAALLTPCPSLEGTNAAGLLDFFTRGKKYSRTAHPVTEGVACKAFWRSTAGISTRQLREKAVWSLSSGVKKSDAFDTCKEIKASLNIFFGGAFSCSIYKNIPWGSFVLEICIFTVICSCTDNQWSLLLSDYIIFIVTFTFFSLFLILSFSLLLSSRDFSQPSSVSSPVETIKDSSISELTRFLEGGFRWEFFSKGLGTFRMELLCFFNNSFEVGVYCISI